MRSAPGVHKDDHRRASFYPTQFCMGLSAYGDSGRKCDSWGSVDSELLCCDMKETFRTVAALAFMALFAEAAAIFSLFVSVCLRLRVFVWP